MFKAISSFKKRAAVYLTLSGSVLMLPSCPETTPQVPAPATSRIETERFRSSPTCPSGGTSVEIWRDLAEGQSNLTQRVEICDGAPGQNGPRGTEGTEGASSTIETRRLNAGELGCSNGGVLIRYGRASVDGGIDPKSPSGEFPVCDGPSGTTGNPGAQGETVLWSVQLLASGSPSCPSGGYTLLSGIDANRNGQLEPQEKTGPAATVCNGAPGLNSLIRISMSPSSIQCLQGGTLIQAGLDSNRNGILEDSEIDPTQTNLQCLPCGASGSAACWNGQLDGPYSFSLGLGTVSGISLADLDSDGKMDAVLSAGSELHVLRGSGQKRDPFILVDNRPLGSSVHQSALADFNRDGRLDLVLASINLGNLRIGLGNSSGSFQTLSPVGLVARPEQVTAVDFDRDGFLDVGIATEIGFSLFRGNGDGTFQAPIGVSGFGTARHFAVSDFNGDGHLDVALCGVPRNVSIFHWSPATGFSAGAVLPITDLCTGVVAHDWNSDGIADLAIARGAFDSTAGILRFNGVTGGGFSSMPVAQWSGIGPISLLQLGRFNADGQLDLFAAGNLSGGGFRTLLTKNQGADFETGAVRSGAVGSASQAAWGDINGDGIPDLVINRGGPGVSVFFGR